MVHDAKRDRDIPVLFYLPSNTNPVPVVLFSHGLGGTRHGSTYLGEHWAARGYMAVFLQHPGSDDSVWKDQAPGERLGGMQKAASFSNFMRRIEDVHAVLDQLAKWNTDPASTLAGRLDMTHVGMSGHSFGAVTTEAVSGQTLPLAGTRLTDTRIKAAIAFSPSTPAGSTAEKAFASVKIPWMLMTGTKDLAIIGNADMKSRLAVYPALRGAPKYELVLHNAEHSVFTDRPLPGDREPRNPKHHRAILALSTAFWDAWLLGSSEARQWLEGAGARSVLEAEDRYQFEVK